MEGRAAARAIATLGVLAALAAIPLHPVGAHDPNASPVEAVGNPAGLAGIPFVGPAGSLIANTVCPSIPDADRWLYYAGPNHIGHVNGVTGTTGTPLNYIDPGSIDLWHFEDSQYSNPAAAEGPHDVTNSAYSVMMGSDGFFRGRMHETIFQGPGYELQITDVHDVRTYCIYGSPYHDGPFLFIDSTYGDNVPGVYVQDVDLGPYYEDIFQAQWPGAPVNMTYVFLVVSPFDDPPPAPPSVTVDFTCTNLDPDGYDMAPGTAFLATGSASDGSALAYSWSFGDGNGGSGDAPTHVYTDDGDFQVTVTASIPGVVGASASRTHTCSALNRPPVAFFQCPPFDGPGVVTFTALSAYDPEGPIATYTWTFGDGSPPETGGQVTHQYTEPGNYTVSLTVQDEDWDSTRPTRAVTSDSFARVCEVPGPRNHPPVLSRPPRPSVPVGSDVRFSVYGRDPDGDTPLAYTAYGLPAGATFDPLTRTFRWQPTHTGFYSGFWFRVTDPDGLYDEKAGGILVFDETSDADTDGIPDHRDNCASVPNHDQADLDHDGQGDACEDPVEETEAILAVRRSAGGAPDADQDGVADRSDLCPTVPDPDQSDLDGDRLGDACDPDLDGDGVPEKGPDASALDNCPLDANPDQADGNGDGVGDACSWRMRDEAGAGGLVMVPRARTAPQAGPGFAETAAQASLAALAMAGTALLVGFFVWRRLRAD